jgi:serine/threonine protein kinase
MSPEVIMGTGYGFEADWWSFGVLLYEMVFGQRPFTGSDRIGAFAAIADCNNAVQFPPRVKASKSLKMILKSLLAKDKAKRLCSANQIKTHAFFKCFNWDKILQGSAPSCPVTRMFKSTGECFENEQDFFLHDQDQGQHVVVENEQESSSHALLFSEAASRDDNQARKRKQGATPLYKFDDFFFQSS